MKAKIQSKLQTQGRISLEEVLPLETPFLLYVDPSSGCNFKCQFCPTGHVDLIKESDYKRSIMKMSTFEKVIDGLSAFPDRLKVMRMNKIGEPTLNKGLPAMIKLAKNSTFIESIDLATNGSMLTPQLFDQLVSAGLDRLNISLEGISSKQYLLNAKVKFDFDKLVNSIQSFYPNRGSCELTIKIPGNLISSDDQTRFYDLFGDYCDKIFIEELSPIWPEFDVESRAKIQFVKDKGQYNQVIKEKSICTYIFYALAINADGTVSACCPDWNQKLVVGNLESEELIDIWNGKQLNELRLLHLSNNRLNHPVCGACGHIKHAQVDDIDAHRIKLFEEFSSKY